MHMKLGVSACATGESKLQTAVGAYNWLHWHAEHVTLPGLGCADLKTGADNRDSAHMSQAQVT